MVLSYLWYQDFLNANQAAFLWYPQCPQMYQLDLVCWLYYLFKRSFFFIIILLLPLYAFHDIFKRLVLILLQLQNFFKIFILFIKCLLRIIFKWHFLVWWMCFLCLFWYSSCGSFNNIVFIWCFTSIVRCYFFNFLNIFFFP